MWTGQVFVTALLFAGALGGYSSSIEVVVKYPEAQLEHGAKTLLYLRGNGPGLDWEKGTTLFYAGEDTWSVTLDASDGQWTGIGSDGEPVWPTAKVLINDDTWQSGSNEVYVDPTRGSTWEIAPWFGNDLGWYSHEGKVHSPQLGNDREITVYFPPSWNENPYRKYPRTLIMHDGQNVFDPNTAFGGQTWEASETLNSLILGQEMPEVFVVAAWNTGGGRIDEYTYSADPEYGGGKGDLYLDFVFDTLVPEIKSRWGDRVSTEDVSMMGSSLGGLISCYAGLTRPESLSKVACMSSSFWWNDEDFRGDVIPSVGDLGNLVVYVDSGDAGPSQDGAPQTKAVYDALTSIIDDRNLWYYLDHGGAHNEASWAHRLHIPLKALFPVDE